LGHRTVICSSTEVTSLLKQNQSSAQHIQGV